MPSFEFEVFCQRCGAGLCNQSSTGNTPGRGMPYVRVEPCEKCLEREYDEGADSRCSELSELREQVRDLEEQLRSAESELAEERNGWHVQYSQAIPVAV